MLSKKTSLLIPSQLPEFIRDDPNYSTFVLFLQSYYEWMEQQGGAVYETKKLPEYFDIDKTLDSFLDYYKTEFLNLFPQGSLVDEKKLIKHSREIFGTKGTPQSFRFLFKVLYNSDVEVFNTKDYVFRASDGKWIVTKQIQLNDIDPFWKSTIGYKVFGVNSSAYAVIESVEQDTDFTTLILTEVQRTFVSGEQVRVLDSLNSQVKFNGNYLTGRIVGIVNSVVISNKGQNYSVNDPIVFYGGLDPNVANPVGANAYISDVSTASFNNLIKVKGGTGYTIGNTDINFYSTGGGAGATAVLKTVDANSYVVQWITTDTIQDPNYPNRENITLNAPFEFPNTGFTDANTPLSLILSHPTLTTYGANSYTIVTIGSGYTPESTSVDILGKYNSQVGKKYFSSLGILSPITIRSAGINYNIGETIIFTSGSGFGAFANVTAIDPTTRGITQISYVQDPAGHLIMPLGGMGYKLESLPTLSVNTLYGTGANVFVSGLVGDDAEVLSDLSAAGVIKGITFVTGGKNYVTTPNVSFRIMDILAYNNDTNNPIQEGDFLIQTTTGTLAGNTTFFANVGATSLYSSNANPLYSNYQLRLYNYSSDVINASSNLVVLRGGELIGANLSLYSSNVDSFISGKRIYGNGQAKGIVKLSQGLQYGNGIFLNSDGQPSGSAILQNEDYNEYTYFLKVSEALNKYKDTALKFLHPSGTHYKTFNKLDDEVAFNIGSSSQTIPETRLSYLLGVYSFSANIANTDFSNTIVFTGLSGANIANVVLPNAFVTFYTDYGQPFTSKVIGSKYANTLILEDNWVTSVPNVAYGQSQTGTNTINIISTTNAWSIATGNTFNYLSDFININDQVTFGVNTSNVMQVTQGSATPTINLYNTVFSNTSGYITVTRNVVTSNIWVAGNVAISELVQIETESGNVLMTEASDIITLG